MALQDDCMIVNESLSTSGGCTTSTIAELCDDGYYANQVTVCGNHVYGNRYYIGW